jgi:hypothetical protein
MMRCGGGVKEGGIGAGRDYSHSMRTRASINDGGRRRPTATTGPHSQLLSIQQSSEHTTIIKRNMQQDYVVKLEKVIIINVIWLL